MPTEVDRTNNFDAIRIIAALAVIVGHAWPLTGLPHPPEVAGIKIYTLAVYVFFAVSGYLITRSWLSTPSVVRFLTARLLRILPALIPFLIVAVFVMGPAVTTSSDYFGRAETWRYLQNVTLVAVYDLPGVFRDHPITAVNGSLWTLGPEFLCYLAVLALGLVAARFPKTRAIAFTLTMAAVAVVASDHVRPAATSMVFFGVGSILASLSCRIPRWPALPLFGLWILVAWLVPSAGILVAWVAVPYAAIVIGRASTPVLRRAGRFGDVSYGTYLWGFPVQQMVIDLLGILSLWQNLAVVVPVTLVIAWGSWHLIEKRALALKSPRSSAIHVRHVRPDDSGSS